MEVVGRGLAREATLRQTKRRVGVATLVRAVSSNDDGKWIQTGPDRLGSGHGGRPRRTTMVASRVADR